MPTLDYFSFGHPLTRIRTFFALRARRRMFYLFMDWARPGPNDRVLDLGVTPDDSLPESNFFERYYPYRHQVVAASIEDAAHLESTFPGVTFKHLAPGPLPFRDRAFRYLFCSAVVEHVGSRAAQREFLSELARVSEHFFVTTPNRWFPVEFHTILPFIHWLPTRTYHMLLRAIGMSRWADTSLLNPLSASELRELFPPDIQVEVRGIKLIGMTSNLIAMGSH